LLRRDQDGLYATAQRRRVFSPAGSGYIAHHRDVQCAALWFWGTLTEGLRTGEPQNEAKSGGDLFANLYTDPARSRGSCADDWYHHAVADALARAFPWATVDRVFDIGSAQGCVPVRLARHIRI